MFVMHTHTHRVHLAMYTSHVTTILPHRIGHPNFELVKHDVVEPYMLEVDEIYHLASPASPPHYMYNPVKTIKTNSVGAHGRRNDLEACADGVACRHAQHAGFGQADGSSHAAGLYLRSVW
jgi:nucleoside-diphosphate-sugar epimerase